ncbi:MAG TPA: nucleotidyltransferase domain-containing protein [Sphingomicrobium sp.]|nr:nucleotidyltransferase domain-containing protein [Sphingomicrobium sp.]
MNREQVIARLKAHERELRAAGVIHLSLFGSVARGEARPDSDIDLLVKLDRNRGIDLFELGGLNIRLQDLLGAAVDLITEPVRRPHLQERIDRDRVLVF